MLVREPFSPPDGLLLCKPQRLPVRETRANGPQLRLFDSLPAVLIRAKGHPSKQGGARSDFDKAIHAKSDQGDASGSRSVHRGHNSFAAVPGDGEILQPPSPLSHRVSS